MKNKSEFINNVNELSNIFDEYLSSLNYEHFTKRMICIDYVEKFGINDIKGFIRDEFTSREVDLKKDYKEEPIVTMHKADYSKCSGTLRHPSHIQMRTDALTQREAELKAREQSWVRMPKIFG